MLRKLSTFVSSASIKDGKLVLDNPAYFKTIVSGYEDTKNVRITLERKRGSKTLNQLGYLYGVVYVEIARHTGYSVQELDAIFKAKYLKKRLMWRGAELTTITSKADLTSDEMGEYISAVVLEGQEMGVEIPDPDKHYDLEESLRMD